MGWKTDWYFSGCGEFSEKLWLFLRKQASVERKHRLCTYMLRKVLWGQDSTHIWKENNWKECSGKKETPKNFFFPIFSLCLNYKGTQKGTQTLRQPWSNGLWLPLTLTAQFAIMDIIHKILVFFFRHTKFKNFYHGALHKIPVKSLCRQSVGSGVTFMSWGLWMSYQWSCNVWAQVAVRPSGFAP